MGEKAILIDIVQDIIKTPYTGGRYKGEEVETVLKSRLSRLKASSLLILDFQKANPLDYVFCQYAFGPIIKEIQENSKPTIFKMQPLHKRCFYRGILKHIDKSLPRNSTAEESRNIFLSAGLYTIIEADGPEDIEFIGSLTDDESTILSFINERKSVSEREIIRAQEMLQPRKIVDSLKSLNKKGFILSPADAQDNYSSIYEHNQLSSNEQ